MDIESKLFSLKGSAIDLKLLHELLAINENGKQVVHQNTKFVLDKAKLEAAGSEILLHKDFDKELGKETTVGRFLFNLRLYALYDLMYEDVERRNNPKQVDVRNKFTYKNITLTASAMDVLYKELTGMMITSEITPQVSAQFIDNLNWIGFVLVPYLNPSLDIKSVNAGPEIRKIKAQVLEEHKDIIINNDVKNFNSVIEAKVLKSAAEILDRQQSTGKMIYDSGVNGTFS
jgi:hypothetical protein